MDTTQKKILYVITKANFGGAQRYVYELAVASKSRGYEVVVATGGNGVLTEKLATARISTHIIRGLSRDIGFLREIRAFADLYTLIRAERPDVIHLNSSKAALLGACAARLLRVPQIIFTAHGWPFLERRPCFWRMCMWLLSWITALLSHYVIVVSKHDKTCAHMIGTRRKTHVIYPAVPSIQFETRERARKILQEHGMRIPQSDALWIVSIAEYVPNKNLLTGIEAVHTAIREQNCACVYILIGTDGDDRKMLESYIQKQNLHETIQLLGYIEDARALLLAFDLFLLPSKKEGLPYALLEAGRARLPCIASNVGGIPEIITHKHSGILFPPHDTASLVHELSAVLNDPKHGASYGNMLYDHVAHTFDFETMVEKTIALYSTH